MTDKQTDKIGESASPMPRELVRDVLAALECGAMWTGDTEAHPRMLRAVDEFRRWAIKVEGAAASPAPTPTLTDEQIDALFRECRNAPAFSFDARKFARAVLAAAPPTPQVARDLADTVLSMDLITPKGIRSRELARQVLGVVPLYASLPPAEPARMLTDEEIDSLHDNARESLAMEMGFGGEGDAMSTDTRKHTRWRRWLVRQARAASVNAGRSIPPAAPKETTK